MVMVQGRNLRGDDADAEKSVNETARFLYCYKRRLHQDSAQKTKTLVVSGAV